MGLVVLEMRLEYSTALCLTLGYVQTTMLQSSAKVTLPVQMTFPQIFCSFQSTSDAATKPSNCSDGELRLVGAITSNQGRLEVCMNGAWGSVCDSQGVFTKDEAKVACRQLDTLQVEGQLNPLMYCS